MSSGKSRLSSSSGGSEKSSITSWWSPVPRAGGTSSPPPSAKRFNNSARLTRCLSGLDESLRGHFEFTDPSLRRATRVSHVLRCFGGTFRNSFGTSATYSLSAQVDEIDCFLSHNWRTPPLGKFAAFALYYNLYLATVVSLAIVSLVVVVLASLECLPVVDADDGIYGRISLVCTLLGTPVFLLVLAFFRDVGHFGGCRGPTCFLDKICIHQEDPQLKRKGIASLGAFLCDSKTMVIAYTDLYLRQLWTVFELGTFLILRSPADMVVLPPVEAALTVASSFFWYISVCGYVLYTVLGTRAGSLGEEVKFFILSVTGVAGLVGISIGLRQLAREREHSVSQALTFRSICAKCSCEDDRPLVNGMIVSLMRELGYVDKSASVMRSLQEFDKLVHLAIPISLAEAFPATGLSYVHALVVVQATFWLQCDRIIGLWQQGYDVEFICAHIILATIVFFTVLPSIVVLVFFLSTQRLKEIGWKQAAILALVPIVCAPIWAVFSNICLGLAADLAARNSRLALAIFAPFEFLLAVMVYFLFRSRRGKAKNMSLKESLGAVCSDDYGDAAEPPIEIVHSCVSLVLSHQTSRGSSAVPPVGRRSRCISPEDSASPKECPSPKECTSPSLSDVSSKGSGQTRTFSKDTALAWLPPDVQKRCLSPSGKSPGPMELLHVLESRHCQPKATEECQSSKQSSKRSSKSLGA